jgi:hypothetical protein
MMRSSHETSTDYFSCSSGTGMDSTKTAMGHITLNLCFASGGIYGSRSAFWCVRGVKYRRTIFHARVGPVWIQQKACRDALCQTCVSAYGGIYVGHVVHSSASVVRNITALFGTLGWDRTYRFHKKRRDTFRRT